VWSTNVSTNKHRIKISDENINLSIPLAPANDDPSPLKREMEEILYI
jgi:hypothetical protein